MKYTLHRHVLLKCAWKWQKWRKLCYFNQDNSPPQTVPCLLRRMSGPQNVSFSFLCGKCEFKNTRPKLYFNKSNLTETGQHCSKITPTSDGPDDPRDRDDDKAGDRHKHHCGLAACWQLHVETVDRSEKNCIVQHQGSQKHLHRSSVFYEHQRPYSVASAEHIWCGRSLALLTCLPVNWHEFSLTRSYYY